MGFLSRLIGQKESTSYVRTWAKQQEKKVKNKKSLGAEDLFTSMIFAVSAFGKDFEGKANKRNRKSQEQQDNAPYSGDASLFEIACYFFFNADLWMYHNKPNYRQNISGFLFRQLAKLFSYALNMDNVSELIVDRLEKYGEVATKDNNAESYHALLSDLIRRTKYNAPPQKYNLNSPRIDFDDSFNDIVMLKMYLLIFEKNMVMAYLLSLRDFLNYVDQNK